MPHAFNPSTWEAEVVGSLWVRGQPGPQSKFQDRLLATQKNPKEKKEFNEQQNISIQAKPQSPSSSLCLYTSVYMSVFCVYTCMCVFFAYTSVCSVHSGVCSVHIHMCVLCIHMCIHLVYLPCTDTGRRGWVLWSITLHLIQLRQHLCRNLELGWHLQALEILGSPFSSDSTVHGLQ